MGFGLYIVCVLVTEEVEIRKCSSRSLVHSNDVGNQTLIWEMEPELEAIKQSYNYPLFSFL